MNADKVFNASVSVVFAMMAVTMVILAYTAYTIYRSEGCDTYTLAQYEAKEVPIKCLEEE